MIMLLPKIKPSQHIEVILFLGALFLFLPGALMPPSNILYNVDELYLVYSAMGLFAGLIPTSLVWPAGTLLFLMVPLYAFDFVVYALSSAGVSARIGDWLTWLSAYLANGFYDPNHSLVLGRTLVAIASAFVPAMAFNLSKRFLDRIPGLFFASLLAISPLFFEYSHILKSDAFAMPFWVVVLLCLFNLQDANTSQAKRLLIISAVSFGIVIATRSTYFVFLPVLFVFAVWILCQHKTSAGNCLRILFEMILGFTIAILLFAPFVWTAPLTFLKTAIGAPMVAITAWRNYSASSIGTLIGSAFPGLVGWGGMILAGLGFVSILQMRRYVFASILLTTLLLFGIPLASSGFIYERYALPLLPILGVGGAFGLSALLQWFKSERAKWIIGILALLVLCINLGEDIERFQLDHQPTARRETTNWLLENISPDAVIAVPNEFMNMIYPNFQSLQRLLVRYASQEQMTTERASQLLEQVGIPTNLSNYPLVFTSAIFGQIEQQDRFRYELMAWASRTRNAPPNARNVIYYAPQPDKLDLVETSLVWQMFDKGDIQVVVTTAKEYNNKKPSRCFSVRGGSGYCVFTTSDELILR